MRMLRVIVINRESKGSFTLHTVAVPCGDAQHDASGVNEPEQYTSSNCQQQKLTETALCLQTSLQVELFNDQAEVSP